MINVIKWQDLHFYMLSLEKFSAKLYEKTVKYQKVAFGTEKCVFGDKIKILLEIITIGSIWVLNINFHANLISNFAIHTFLGGIP